MGLDISVSMTPNEFIEYYADLPRDEAVRPEFEAALGRLGVPGHKPYSCRPGGYSGLHLVRVAYAKLKGWPVNWDRHGGTVNVAACEAALESHLVNHSDCDGWYLPDTFEHPNVGSVSIGSSRKLVAELMELDRKTMDERTGESWDVVFVAAVLSAFGGQPIKFH